MSSALNCLSKAGWYGGEKPAARSSSTSMAGMMPSAASFVLKLKQTSSDGSMPRHRFRTIGGNSSSKSASTMAITVNTCSLPSADTATPAASSAADASCDALAGAAVPNSAAAAANAVMSSSTTTTWRCDFCNWDATCMAQPGTRYLAAVVSVA